MKTMFLIRHASSEGNLVTKVCNENGFDYPVSFKAHTDRETRLLYPNCVRDAESLVKRMDKILESCSVVLCSDYARTQETASIVEQLMGRKIPFKVESLLNERNWGVYERLSLTEKTSIQRRKSKDPFGTIITDGESLNQVKMRFLALDGKYGCSRGVVCFTHQEFMISAISEFLGLSTEQFKEVDLYKMTPNCCVVELVSRDDGSREVYVDDGQKRVELVVPLHKENSFREYQNKADIYKSEIAKLLEGKVA